MRYECRSAPRRRTAWWSRRSPSSWGNRRERAAVRHTPTTSPAGGGGRRTKCAGWGLLCCKSRRRKPPPLYPSPASGGGSRQHTRRAQVTAETPIFNRLALIGFGLIGGSIARAAREQGAVHSIVATARSLQTRQRVAELGLVDQVVESNA